MPHGKKWEEKGNPPTKPYAHWPKETVEYRSDGQLGSKVTFTSNIISS